MIRILSVLLLCGSSVCADTIVATRTIRAQEVISVEDIALNANDFAGGTNNPAELIGQEARVAIYAGRPIRPSDLVAPAVIERNQVITLIFNQGGLTISTEGRALDRAAPGDWIRVMNLSSRTTITAEVTPQGTALVYN